MIKATTIVTFKAGLANLWIGCALLHLTDNASVLSDLGAVLGAGGVLLLGLAILGTLALGVRTACASD